MLGDPFFLRIVGTVTVFVVGVLFVVTALEVRDVLRQRRDGQGRGRR